MLVAGCGRWLRRARAVVVPHRRRVAHFAPERDEVNGLKLLHRQQQVTPSAELPAGGSS